MSLRWLMRFVIVLVVLVIVTGVILLLWCFYVDGVLVLVALVITDVILLLWCYYVDGVLVVYVLAQTTNHFSSLWFMLMLCYFYYVIMFMVLLSWLSCYWYRLRFYSCWQCCFWFCSRWWCCSFCQCLNCCCFCFILIVVDIVERPSLFFNYYDYSPRRFGFYPGCQFLVHIWFIILVSLLHQKFWKLIINNSLQ